MKLKVTTILRESNSGFLIIIMSIHNNVKGKDYWGGWENSLKTFDELCTKPKNKIIC